MFENNEVILKYIKSLREDFIYKAEDIIYLWMTDSDTFNIYIYIVEYFFFHLWVPFDYVLATVWSVYLAFFFQY